MGEMDEMERYVSRPLGVFFCGFALFLFLVILIPCYSRYSRYSC
jgi:hypothetical protein